MLIRSLPPGARIRVRVYSQEEEYARLAKKYARLRTATPREIEDALWQQHEIETLQCAFSLIAHSIKGTSANGGAGTAIDSTGATLLVCVMGWFNGGGTPTLSDSKGNTWSHLTATVASNNYAVRISYAENPTSVGTSHTVSASGTGIYPFLGFSAWSGAATSGVFDVQNGSAITPATSGAFGSVTPSANDSLYITGMCNQSSTHTVGTVTLLGQVNDTGGTFVGGGHAYEIQTTATARNPPWSWSSSVATAGRSAVFKVSGGGGVPSILRQILQQHG